jgi:3D-(3,5/4)-trihydroxycyclohexane-1,2-dione acylhydrolase (decyclizing)
VTGQLTGDVLPLDLAANAASLGAEVRTAHGPDELGAALAAPAPADRPLVIVAETDTSEEVPGYASWWDVPVAEVSGREQVREAYRAYASNVARERNLP